MWSVRFERWQANDRFLPFLHTIQPLIELNFILQTCAMFTNIKREVSIWVEKGLEVYCKSFDKLWKVGSPRILFLL